MENGAHSLRCHSPYPVVVIVDIVLNGDQCLILRYHSYDSSIMAKQTLLMIRYSSLSPNFYFIICQVDFPFYLDPLQFHVKYMYLKLRHLEFALLLNFTIKKKPDVYNVYRAYFYTCNLILK